MTRSLLSASADREPWQPDHDEAQRCFDLQEALAWGIQIFRGLNEQEARFQIQAMGQLNDRLRVKLDTIFPEHSRRGSSA